MSSCSRVPPPPLRASARMTASWLVQMGWRDVAVLEGGLEAGPLETGVPQPSTPPIATPDVETVSATCRR